MPPFHHAFPAGAVTLDELESKAVLRAAGIPVTADVCIPLDAKLLHDGPIGPAEGGGKIAFPVALELLSRDIAHQSDIGGLLACPMVDGGIEVIVGVVNDETFGPVVALGLGGVLAETLKDVVFRIAPIGRDEALSRIAELRAAAVFDGERGRPSADCAALADVLVKVSALAWALRGIALVRTDH